ncbi:MAG: response regulator [Phycisphaerae bacterium]|nr:response regulator [Phycisphaerae bacterium]
MNLAGNAVKFTEVGSVTIRAMMQSRGTQQQLVIDIEDTGPGMALDGQERLFTPFVQGDTTVTRRFGGTGLGLTICRRLARLMDGDVTLVSSTPSVGSVFRVTLPVEPVPGCAMTQSIMRIFPTAAEAPVPTRVTGRILLAEDGPDNRRLILFHLRKAGADVASAVDGREALAMIDRANNAGAPYDLLLTDMQMPEIDGYDLARILRRQGDTMPIIALTAHAMAEDRKRCIDAGCDDYLSKPIDKSAMLRTCERWLRERRDAFDSTGASGSMAA